MVKRWTRSCRSSPRRARASSASIEASEHVDRTIALIKEQGCKAGLVLNPARAGVVARPHPRKARPRAAHVVNPASAGSSSSARCCRRSRSAPRIDASPRYLARGRRRDQDRQHRGSRARRRRYVRRRLGDLRLEGLRGDHPRHAAEPLSGKALTNYTIGSGRRRGARICTRRSRCTSSSRTRPRICSSPWSAASASGAIPSSASPAPSASRITARGCTVRRLLRDARGADVCLESVERSRSSTRAWLGRHRVAPVPAALRFGGGLAGYFGYEAVRHIEKNALKEENPIRSARPTCCCSSPTSSR